MNKGKAVGIAGGLTLLAGALWAGWYFFIKTKQDDLADARAEVVRWEERISAFRACMFGDKPASTDSAEALAMRDLLNDYNVFSSNTQTAEAQKSCTKLAAKLNRGVADDTGNMTVEHAWMTVDRAASKVATSFAVYKSDYGVTEADRRRGVKDLPSALEELDNAREELRAAAKMPPAEAIGKTLPKAEVITLKSLRRFPRRSDWSMNDTGIDLPSRNSILDRAIGDGDKQWRILHAAGGTPIVVAADPDDLAFPNGDWDVESEVDAGATLDPKASALGPGPAHVLKIRPTKKQFATGVSNPSPFFNLGTPENGLAVYTAYRPVTRAEIEESAKYSESDLPNGRKLVIASVNAAFTEKTFPVDQANRAVDAQGNAALVWTEPVTAAHRGAVLQPGIEPKIVELGTGQATHLCLSTGYGWVTDSAGQTVRFSADGTMTSLQVQHRLLACGDRAAVFHDVRDEFEVCAKDCRTVTVPGAGNTQFVTVSDEKVVAIRMRDKVLGVWMEGKQPVFFALPDVLEARAVVANGKVVDILASVNTVRPADQQVMIVRAPLP